MPKNGKLTVIRSRNVLATLAVQTMRALGFSVISVQGIIRLGSLVQSGC